MAFGGLANPLSINGRWHGPGTLKFYHLGYFPRRFDCIATEWPNQNVVGLRNTPDIWMSLDDVMAMYWRVKKWRWSVSMTWAERSAAQAVFSFDRFREVHAGQVSILFEDQTAFPDVISEIVTEAPTGDETSLVCGFPSPVVTETIFPDIGDPFEASAFYNQHFHARIGDFWKETSGDTDSGTRARAIISWGGPVAETPDLGYGYPAYSRRGENGRLEYMPSISVSLGTARWEIRVYPDPNGLEESYGTFAYKFLGNTYTCPIYATNTIADTDPSFSNTLSVSATLEALEYWPYEVNDGGGPIYDPDTGERLR